MPKTEPKTINDLIKILAYNDWAWSGSMTHPKDKPTTVSLAEAQYPWTEKQAKLALAISKRYATKFESRNLEVKNLLKNPAYDFPFRIINAEKIIETLQDDKGIDKIELKFPYNKKLVSLIRCLKNKDIPNGYFIFDGETKVWTITKTDVTTYYCTLIAMRYNFTFVDDQLLNEFEDIQKEKCKFKKPNAKLDNNQIILQNVSESLQTYWQEKIQEKKLLLQLDSLKQFKINQKGLKVKAYSIVGEKIAHNSYRHLWINKKNFNKDQVILGLQELDCFPIVMPISGEIVNLKDDILEMSDWIKCFERHGISEFKNISWGFTLREPKMYKDKTPEEKDGWGFLSEKIDQPTFDIAYDLYQSSKSFKNLYKDTKIYFIRSKLTRSLMRSNLDFKCSLTAIGGGYYASGGENIKRFLDNLPKRLYYSDYKPTTYEWNSRSIEQL